MMGVMKTVVRVKLLPTAEQSQVLSRTLVLCNEQASVASAVAFERHITKAYDLQKVVYGQLKAAGLTAQASIRVIKKTVDAYATLRANLRNGNLGTPGSKRRAKATSKPIVFRATAAQPYDDRILGWNHLDRTVSIWVLDNGTGKPGRITVPFTGQVEQLVFLAAHRKGESDLMVDREGRWYLSATCDVPEPAVSATNGMVGIDMGIVNIATTSHVDADGARLDGTTTNWSGGAVTFRRKKNRHMRRELQKKNTKSAKRKLGRRSGKEARFVKDTNHKISKQIVTEAKRTGRGIAVENLTGIRDRVRLRKPQRVEINSWAFAQLGQHLLYKAALAGVYFVQVDPRNTSKQCSGCGYIAKANRPNRDTFRCKQCGLSLEADDNASTNIARRGLSTAMEVLVGSSQPAKRDRRASGTQCGPNLTASGAGTASSAL